MLNIAVFASGRGSNFAAIIRAVKKGKVKANLALLISDNPKAGAIGKAKRAGVRIALVKREDFTGKEDFEGKIIEHLNQAGIGTQIHYPIPIPKQEAYKECFKQCKNIPHAIHTSEKILSLPLFPELREEEVTEVCNELSNILSLRA